MRGAGKFFTARATVTSIFLGIVLALLTANILPQRTPAGKSPGWLETFPAGHYLGLDDIIGSWWFAGLILLFGISLVFSTVAQYGAARRLAGGPREPALNMEWLPVEDAGGIAGRLEAAGYRPAESGAGTGRYVKHRSGYWGSFLLHLGLVITVVFSLVYVVTQNKALVQVTGDEITRLVPENMVVKRGLLPLQRRYPESVSLARVEPKFWSNDKLEALSSELYVTDRPGELPARVDVALSDKSHFGSFRVYQGNPYGLSFDLDLASPDGEIHQERLQLHYPVARGTAGYGEAAVTGTELMLKGKFVPDAEGKTMAPRSPLLTLRLLKGEKLLGETSLRPGERGTLGPWSVRLTRTAWWTEILLDGSCGMEGIFIGFAVILIGVLCSYCFVPREIFLRQEGAALLAQLQVRRFTGLYHEEFEAVAGRAKPQEGS